MVAFVCFHFGDMMAPAMMVKIRGAFSFLTAPRHRCRYDTVSSEILAFRELSEISAGPPEGDGNRTFEACDVLYEWI
jgi:hypothetical protein